MVLTLSVILFPTLPWLRTQTEVRLLDEDINLLQRIQADWTGRLDERFASAHQSIARFSSLVSTMQLLPAEVAQASFDSIVRLMEDGSWRTDREKFDSGREAGIWLQRGHPVSEDQTRFLITAKLYAEVFGQGAVDQLANTWILPKEGGNVIYWPSEPEYIYDAAPDLDYTETDWGTLTMPEENPQGEPRWTPTSFDPAPKIWMISVVAPFFQEGKWAGSVGHDLPIDRLAEQIHEVLVHPGTRYSLVRDDGILLLSNQYHDRIIETSGTFSIADTGNPNLMECYGKVEAGEDATGVTHRYDGDYVVFATRIEDPGWYLLVEVPRSEMLKAVRSSYGTLWTAVGIALALVGIAIPVLVSRVLLPPVKRLLRGTRAVASGKLDYHFPPEWSAEFFAISNSIESMVQKLKAALEQARQAEAAASESSKQYQSLVSSIPGAVYRCRIDRMWTMNFLSDQIKNVTGYEACDFVDNARIPFGEIIHPEDRELVWNTVAESMERDQPFTLHYRILHRDGSIRHVLDEGSILKGAPGEAPWNEGAIFDVTEQRLAEQRLAEYREKLEDLVKARTHALKEAQSALITEERMAMIGRVAATVSHELKNPLGTIRGSFYVLSQRIKGQDESTDRVLQRIERSIARCDRIIEEMLGYTRQKGVDTLAVELDTYLKDYFSEWEAPEGIELKLKLDTAGVRVKLDPDRIRQCMVNLLTNACDAMTDQGGRASGEVTVSTCVADGFVAIRVSDTGSGIPEDLRDKVFEPLFTTKGFGVGLGLPLVKQIMQQHGGAVEVASSGAAGTTMVLTLPLVNEPAVVEA